MLQSLQKNAEQIQHRIADACSRAGRDVDEITLIWVSKTQPQEIIKTALQAGAQNLGENKVQEVQSKYAATPDLPGHRLHFIGHLQSNKVKAILPYIYAIHSVDSVKLAQRINRIAGELKLKPKIFFQVNTSGETSKFGFTSQRFLESLPNFINLGNIELAGLMTIAPFSNNHHVCRMAFRKLRELSDKANSAISHYHPAASYFKELSMGMSNDFEVAIEEGSHYIRIGTQLFGERRR